MSTDDKSLSGCPVLDPFLLSGAMTRVQSSHHHCATSPVSFSLVSPLWLCPLYPFCSLSCPRDSPVHVRGVSLSVWAPGSPHPTLAHRSPGPLCLNVCLHLFTCQLTPILIDTPRCHSLEDTFLLPTPVPSWAKRPPQALRQQPVLSVPHIWIIPCLPSGRPRSVWRVTPLSLSLPPPQRQASQLCRSSPAPPH